MKTKLKNRAQILFTGDPSIWVVALLLAVYSILVVYSSTCSLAFNKQGGDTEYYLMRHTAMLFGGFVLMVLASKVPFIIYSRLSQVLLWVVVPLLVYTLVGGANLNNASRWLVIPFLGLTFQPSDLAKLVIILYTSRMINKLQVSGEIDDFKAVAKKIMAPILLICVLILPANFSTAALIGLSCFVLMFVAGVHVKHLTYLVGLCVVMALLAIAVAVIAPNLLPRAETWMARIENFGSEESEGNFQSEHSKMAIATGGLVGVGPGHSMQRNILPHSSSDFIFAITIEEYGSFISFIVITLFMILAARGRRICRLCSNNFGAYAAFGITFTIVVQAFVNMMVATGIIPVTGQTLPLVSMGGTSIMLVCISLGIVLSISRSLESEAGVEVVTKSQANEK